VIYSTNSFHEPAATCDRAVFLGCRGEVVLRLLLDTGVRVSELCGLALTDVGLGWQLAYVTGKGSRPCVVPFGARTAQAVDRYLRVRALKPHARSPRLLGQRGLVRCRSRGQVPILTNVRTHALS
jgi:site-specific recombinase XerD